MGEATHWQGVYGKSLYLPLNFAVTLKLFKIKVRLIMKYISILPTAHSLYCYILMRPLSCLTWVAAEASSLISLFLFTVCSFFFFNAQSE